MSHQNLIIRINNLSINEKKHIFSILQSFKIDYSKNRNGLFYNLSSCSEEIIQKLKTCIDLIEHNRDLVFELDKKRLSKLKEYREIIEAKTNLKKKEEEESIYELLYIKEQSHVLLIERDEKESDSNMYIKMLFKKYLNGRDFSNIDDITKHYNLIKKTMFKTKNASIKSKSQSQPKDIDNHSFNFSNNVHDFANCSKKQLDDDNISVISNKIDLDDIVSIISHDDDDDNDGDNNNNKNDVENENESDFEEDNDFNTVFLKFKYILEEHDYFFNFKNLYLKNEEYIL